MRCERSYVSTSTSELITSNSACQEKRCSNPWPHSGAAGHGLTKT
jgi:hypothetical protein